MDIINYSKIKKVEQDLATYMEEYTTQRQQDNLKVATVEKGLNDYKSTIANVNVNQEAKQKVSGYGTISLPKNAANGQVSVSLFGRTYTNTGGSVGDCENVADFEPQVSTLSLDSTNKVFGSNSIVAVATGSSSGFGLNPKVGKFPIDATKYYLVSAFGRVIDATSWGLNVTKGSTFAIIGTATSGLTNTSFQRSAVKLQPSDLVGETSIRPYIRGVSAGIGTRVSTDGIMVVEISASDYNLTLDELMKKYPYVFGTKSTISASRLKSVGENLFDYSKTKHGIYNTTTGLPDLNTALDYKRSPKIRLNPSKTYKISGYKSVLIIYKWDINNNYLGFTNTNTESTFTNIGYIAFRNSVVSSFDYSIVQLEEGAVATPYEPYTESTQYISVKDELGKIVELRSLPSAKDEIRVSGGKAELVKRVSDKIVFNGTENWLNGGVVTLGSFEVYRASLTDYVNNNNLPKKDNAGYAYNDLTQFSYLITESTTKTPYLIYGAGAADETLAIAVDKSYLESKYSLTLNGFKQYLVEHPITLTYQLAQEVVSDIQTSGNLISYPSGTIYVENVVADAGIYTTKFDIKDLQLPIKSVDKLIKYNFTTGVQTVLDATLAVINADKKSFTHPNLANKDMVFVDYFYDVESTLGETTIEYYDSRHTIKDTTNNKFYSWNIKSTNGVATVALTEVL